MQMVVQGVSTRRVKKITTELCGREFSRSTVSRLTEDLEEQVQAWAERSLEQEYPFLMLDAMHLEVRRQGAVRSTAVLLAVGIGEDGQREILGLSGGPQRDRAGLGAAHRPAQGARALRRRGGHQRCTRGAEASPTGGVSGPDLAEVSGALQAQRDGSDAGLL